MKKMLMVGAILLAAAVSNAASTSSSAYSYSRGMNTLTPVLGFTSSAVNFGVDFEHRLETTYGVGGYFLYSAEKKDGTYKNHQVTSFGGIMPVHVLDDAHFDIYLGPGFGFHMFKGFQGEDDVTTLGPVWKTGALFKLTSNLKLGLEQTQIVNWFTDKAPSDGFYTNAALAISF